MKHFSDYSKIILVNLTAIMEQEGKDSSVCICKKESYWKEFILGNQHSWL